MPLTPLPLPRRGANRLALLILIAFLAYSANADDERPNIVFILTDDIGYGDVGPYKDENSPLPTPNIDLLAEQGITFTDAHSTSAVCAPSRYSLLTGNYPFRGLHRWGVWDFNRPLNVHGTQRTIAESLHDAGYATGFFGKLHMGGDFYKKGANYFYRGSDALQIDFEQRFQNGPTSYGFNYSWVMTNGIQGSIYGFFKNDLYKPINPAQPEVVPLPAGEWNGGYQPKAGFGDPNWNSRLLGPILVRQAVKFIDSHVAAHGADKPFFVYYSTPAAHTPYTPPYSLAGHPIAGVTGIDARADIFYEIDIQVGEILAALEKHGVADNTLIIFSSDNGGYTTTKQLAVGHDSVGGLRGKKALLYEGGHRVPFIVKWGDGTRSGSQIAPGTVSDQLIGIHDWVATASEIIGQPGDQEQALDSVSFLPVLLGNQPEESPIRQELILQAGSLRNQDEHRFYAGIRKDQWVLIVDAEETPVELYNLEIDLPQEDNRIADPAQADRIASMNESFRFALHHSERTTPSSPCGEPNYDRALDAGAFLWRDCTSGSWITRFAAAGLGFRRYNGQINSSLGFDSVTPYLLESKDSLDATTDSHVLTYRLQLIDPNDDGFSFETPMSSDLCFDLDLPRGTSMMVGPDRVPVSLPFNPNTFGPCYVTEPRLSVSNASADETDGTVTYILKLYPASAEYVTVDYLTTDGTATAGEDYKAEIGTALLEAGVTEFPVTVQLFDDYLVEGDEFFNLAISNPVGAILGDDSGTATIEDDDIAVCGAPDYDRTLDAGAFIWRDCTSGEWVTRFAAAGLGFRRYNGSIASSLGFDSITPFLLESTDNLDATTDPYLLSYQLELINPNDDGFSFTTPTGSELCFDLELPNGAQMYAGPDRTLVDLPFDPQTLGPCL